MQLQFDSKPFRCLQYALQETVELEEVLELRIPETGEITILCAKGQPLLRGKDWHGDRAGVTGGVAVSVLYLNEEGIAGSCDGWLPFQKAWTIPCDGKDGVLSVCCSLCNLDARLTGADKVMVTVSLSLSVAAYVPAIIQLPSADDLPEDIHLLRKSYPVCVPVEAGERSMPFEEEMVLPPGKADIRQLLHASLQCGTMEQKPMADKLVFRGAASVKVLYLGVDGGVDAAFLTLPVSQYVQLEHIYGAEAEAALTLAVTNLETERLENGRLRVKGSLVGQYVICDRPLVELVEDAYSNQRSVAVEHQSLPMTQLLAGKELMRSLQTAVSVRAESVVCSDVYYKQPHISSQGEKFLLHTEGTVQLLYYGEDGRLQCVCTPWQLSQEESAGEQVRLSAEIKSVGNMQLTASDDGVAAAWDMQLVETAWQNAGLPASTGLKVEEKTAPEGRRPALILRKAGEYSLWELAKFCGSSMEAIRKANQLSEDPAADRMLLIPVE